MGEETILRRAKDSIGELLLRKVALTDHYEYNVLAERLDGTYSKSHGWFHSEGEADEVFDLVKKNWPDNSLKEEFDTL